MEKKIFGDFDFIGFWDDDEYALKQYVESPPSDELIESIEEELGYKLPGSYIELMKLHNGGMPIKTCFPTTERTYWAEDHVAITGIKAIGREKDFSLCGTLGSRFAIEEAGYPDRGVYICDCPSAGHDMILLDYSNCGRSGEPEVVHVDQENDHKITFLAKDFESFIRGLVGEDVYDTSEQDLADSLEKIRTGQFSDILQQYFKAEKTINFDRVLRNLLTELTKEKGYFALHADPLSYLAYDIQYYLLTLSEKIRSKEAFVRFYPGMIAMGNSDISTGGYASFFEDWFDERVKGKYIVKGIFSGFHFTDGYKKIFLEKIKRYE